jgi:hypothetical protein
MPVIVMHLCIYALPIVLHRELKKLELGNVFMFAKFPSQNPFLQGHFQVVWRLLL